MQETDATNLNNAVSSNADKKLSSSLYYVLGLTMADESKSFKTVRNVAVGEGAITLHKLSAECQPDIVNRHCDEKDSTRLNSCAQMRAEVVALLRAEAALHMPVDVDGACMSGPKGKEKTKGKGLPLLLL